MFKILIREKYTILLCTVLLNAIAAPFFTRTVGLELFLNLTFSLVMLTAVFSLSRGGKTPLAASIFLMLPCLFFIWWTYFYSSKGNMMLVSAVFEAFFMMYIALLIVISIFRSPRITHDVISAAIVVYLFVALVFNKLYLILEISFPGSFSVSHAAIMEKPGLLRYFSMVTLSTLGYGDISPVSPKAQAMASVEAIFGQVYLAVLIARLVSLYGVEFSGKRK